MAERRGQHPVWYLIGCVGLLILSVPCLGMGAALAIPGFVSYARRAKAAEARTHLGALRQGVEAECVSGGRMPAALGPTLAMPGPEEQVPTLDPRWTALGLTPEPMRYAYAIERPGDAVLLVVAEGDLDGDGVRSRFSVTCVRGTTTAGCSCGELTVTDELE